MFRGMTFVVLELDIVTEGSTAEVKVRGDFGKMNA